MHGLGPIPTEENEPYFHHEWERRVFPLFASLFVGGHLTWMNSATPLNVWIRPLPGGELLRALAACI
jgi:hypothetical protein